MADSRNAGNDVRRTQALIKGGTKPMNFTVTLAAPYDIATSVNFSTAGGNGFPRESLKLHDPKPNELRATPVTGPLTAWGSNVMGYLVRYLNQLEKALE